MPTFGRSEGEGTVIGTHVKLAGILSDPNDIVVLGRLDGEVHSDHSVTIGPNAHVKGPVTAARVILEGTVRGNIHTRDRLEILPKGNLAGNIETRDLVIHSGATFNGRCQIIGGEAASKQPGQEPTATVTPSESAVPAADRSPETPEPAPESAQEQGTDTQPRRRMWPGIRIANFGRKESNEKAPKKDEPKETQPPGYEVEE